MAIDRSRILTTILLIVVVVLIGQVYWQNRRIAQLQSSMEFQQRQFEAQVGKLAAEKLKNQRGNVLQAAQWLPTTQIGGRPAPLRLLGGLIPNNRLRGIGAWNLRRLFERARRGQAREARS